LVRTDEAQPPPDVALARNRSFQNSDFLRPFDYEGHAGHPAIKLGFRKLNSRLESAAMSIATMNPQNSTFLFRSQSHDVCEPQFSGPMASPSYIRLIGSNGLDARVKRQVRADLGMLAERDRISAR
jgi:hypothetical protein